MVVLDRWAVHRKAAKSLFGGARFWIEWLPPYASDLNPVEPTWKHTKYGDLANYVPDDLLDLELKPDWSIHRTRGRSDLLRSFFHAVAEGPLAICWWRTSAVGRPCFL